MDDNVIGATQAEVAHHEAGHAVVGASLGWDVHGSWIGHLIVEWHGQTDADGGFTSVIERITVLLGGGAGEARYLGDPETFPAGCRDEWVEACEIAESECAGDPEAVVSGCWDDARSRLAGREPMWLEFADELLRAGALGKGRCRQLLEIPMSAWFEADIGER
jgi:hypothetical protein